jgi:hypothetical protein
MNKKLALKKNNMRKCPGEEEEAEERLEGQKKTRGFTRGEWKCHVSQKCLKLNGQCRARA